MTVSTSTNKAGPYAGAGLPGPFTVPFRFLSASHLQVIKTSTAGIDTVLTLTTDYTVAGVGAATGSVTLTAPLAVGDRLTIIRDVPFTQLADYVNNDAFPAESHEDALDLLTMQTQQLKERSDAALTLPATAFGTNTDLPFPQSNRLIGWNEAASGLQNFDATTLATIVAFGTSRADTFTGNGTQTQFALTANPGALANLDVAIGGVTQTPGVDYTYSGTTLTFISGAPPLGAQILARYFLALPQGVTDSAAATFLQAGAGASPRNVQSKLRDVVSVKDFGVVGDGIANDTAAMGVALALNVSLSIPEGDYLVDNLTWSANSRKMIALGRVRFIKRANGPILTISGSRNTLHDIEFWGDAATPVFTGDNLVISGDSNTLINCGSRWAFGRALRCTGNQLSLIGTCDVYQTADASATGFDIDIGGASLTLYHRITDILSSQATGGILLTNTGAASIKGSQFGKLTADKGVASPGNHGPYVVGCRINGAINIQQSNTSIDCSSASSNVTIGNSISGVALGDSFNMASGTTVAVGSGLSSCQLDVLAKLEDGGVTVTIDPTTLTGPNNIGITEKLFAAAISAVGGTPSLGNGSLTMYFSRRGRRYSVSFRFIFGSTTNMGTGTFYISLPVVPRNTIARIGSAQVLDSGTAFFVAAVQSLADGTARMAFVTHGAASQVTSSVPMTWANGDDIQGSVEFDV